MFVFCLAIGMLWLRWVTSAAHGCYKQIILVSSNLMLPRWPFDNQNVTEWNRHRLYICNKNLLCGGRRVCRFSVSLWFVCKVLIIYEWSLNIKLLDSNDNSNTWLESPENFCQKLWNCKHIKFYHRLDSIQAHSTFGFSNFILLLFVSNPRQ